MVESVDKVPRALDASGNHQKPRTRQRIHKQPTTLPVPDINDDAAERKRVLNVLAQRRYRERKRQTAGNGRCKKSTTAPESFSHENEPSLSANVDISLSDIQIQDNEANFSSFLNGTSMSMSECATSQSSDLTTTQPFVSDNLFGMDEILTSIKPSVIPSSEGCSTMSYPLFDTDSMLPIIGSSSPPTSSYSEDSDVPISVDSYYLPMNELTLMRGLLRIANRLQCNAQTMWNLETNSPFNDGTQNALTIQQLPPTWQPTFSQRSIPHHPVIDLFPWPSVRDRILLLLSLPDESRPPIATGPLAIVQLAYDLEDSSEGARIWGGDPYEVTSWEVGQALFERWWFIFDRKVIDQSNYWRKMRGAPALTTKSES